MSQTEISSQKKMVPKAFARVFCIEQNDLIEASFCKYVCTYALCSPSVNPIKAKETIHDYQSQVMRKELRDLSISLNFTKGQNLNIIQEQYLREPRHTKTQVAYLQHFPQIGHKQGESWPSCDCLACCGALIITVMETASPKKAPVKRSI